MIEDLGISFIIEGLKVNSALTELNLWVRYNKNNVTMDCFKMVT